MKALLPLCLFSLGASSLRAQVRSEASLEACKKFAQSFYDWYAGNDQKELRGKTQITPWGAAIKYRPHSFSGEIVRALTKADAKGETEKDAVLDFDPILNTQDPADHYVVRRVSYKSNTCRAEVYGVWSRPVSDQGKRPQVVAEMAFEAGRWHFVNFHYPNSTNPENENLLAILKYQYQPK
ncbi:MAG TPA: hypothetical protein VFI45_12150 [Candidatus Acidoferrum sp.]|nr:hypothetical protein [Candidatus Acidoferrum sp.]